MRYTNHTTNSWTRLVIGTVAILVTGSWITMLSGCGGSDRGSSTRMTSASSQDSRGPGAAVGSADRSKVMALESAPGAPVPPAFAAAEAAVVRREIIYTGEMSVEVDDVEISAGRLEKEVRAGGGWVSSRQLNTDSEGHRSAVVEIRVPSSGFEGIHERVKKLGELVQDAIQSRDVGKEFVDLEARLRNLQREETVIAGLFDRRGKITEVLEVERELARVRGEVEQTQGQLRYLRDQVSYSTLRITLAPKRPAIERKMESWNLGYHVLFAWRLLVGLARLLTYLAIYALVIGVPLAILAWGIWRVLRNVKRRPPPLG